jgi:hypothetical protein
MLDTLIRLLVNHFIYKGARKVSRVVLGRNRRKR